MHYTQQDGVRYHYIDDREFDRLYERVVPFRYDSPRSKRALGKHAVLGPYEMLLRVHEDREQFRPLVRFDSGDGLKEGDLEWEMEAVLYTYVKGVNLLMVRELYWDEENARCMKPRWYLVDEEDE